MTTKQQLIKDYGKEKVSNIIEMVSIADPDFVYTLCQDQEDEDGCSIIEALYFEQD